MSEISESEIKSMTKEQNYMCGYENGKSDVLDKIKDEIIELRSRQNVGVMECLDIIDKYMAEKGVQKEYLKP